jgi:hypothetical protein
LVWLKLNRRVASVGDRLDQRGSCGERHDSVQCDAGSRQHAAEFVLCAFASDARDHQHFEVDEAAEVRLICRLEDEIPDQDAARRRHCVPTVAQNFDARIVVPVVQNCGHDVGVGAGGHALEEVARHCAASIGKLTFRHVGRHCIDDVRPVEDNALQCREVLENSRHQSSVAAADAAGHGFTHHEDNLVTITAPELGTLANRMRSSAACEPWSFGIGALMANLARRGVLASGRR